jgi:hypothetical protein
MFTTLPYVTYRVNIIMGCWPSFSLARHSLLHRDRDIDHFEKFLGFAVIHPSH